MKRILNRLNRYANRVRLWHYKRHIASKVEKLKNKSQIKILFVVSELGTWKTENLYNAMRANERFEAILGICESAYDKTQLPNLQKYVVSKGYDYLNLEGLSINKDIAPDIIFYQKPYGNAYSKHLLYINNLQSLFCYVNYAFNILNEPWAVHNELGYLCWQFYMENDMVLESRKQCMYNHGANLVCTGLPMMDALCLPKSNYHDVWKPLGKRKRIIYAPHHTIGDQHSSGINYSTFLEWGDFVLALAKKYSKETQWAFKPHPLLRMKLYRVWEKERVDNYFHEWEKLENTQVELGKYESLFAYSDAMIHDCSSFQIEYHYTKNPVLYLVRDESHDGNINEFSKKAYNLHYHAHNTQEIESFVLQLINGVDAMRKQRESFFESSLLPPHGKSACENIMNAILGIEEYVNI